MRDIKLNLNISEIEEIQTTLKDKIFKYERETNNLNDRKDIEECLSRAFKLKCLVEKIDLTVQNQI